MTPRPLGQSGLTVSPLGLGCMGMTWAYGSAPDRAEMIALLRAAVGGAQRVSTASTTLKKGVAAVKVAQGR